MSRSKNALTLYEKVVITILLLFFLGMLFMFFGPSLYN